MCLTFSYAQRATDINILEPNFKEATLTKQYIYSDAHVAKGIEAVLKNDTLFHYEEKKFLNSGVFTHYNWVKIKIKNKSEVTKFVFEVNQTYLDSLQFYVVKGAGKVHSYPKKGLHFKDPDDTNFLSNKYAYVYPITIAQNEALTVYMRAIVNDGAFRVTNKIWTEKHYETRKLDIKIRTSYLIFFGGFTVLVVLISIAMFIFSKKRIYLYYTFFVAVVFINLLGLRHFVSPLYIEKYLFFGNSFTEMFALLQVTFILLYLNKFLPIKVYYPKVYIVLKYTAIFTFVFFISGLFLRRFDWFYGFSFYFTKAILLVVTVFMYAIALKLAFKKELMAYYFLLAYFPLMSFVAYYILTAFKLTNGFNPLQWEIVIFVEIFVLTIAMSHKYYLLIQENRVYERKIYEQRLKISRDLHDNIGAQLTFIISSIDNLQYGFNIKNDKLTGKLNSISAFTKDTIYELRDTIWAMNKDGISLEDLQVRISNFIDKAHLASRSTQFSFNIDKLLASSLEFTSVQGMNMYRIIQEAVNNAIKYAGATHVNVDIKKENNSILFSIIDNGKGFNAQTIIRGNGLNNIKKRASDINASLKIESKIDKGTQITFSVKV
ncbi:hypothetical protein GCM10022291_20460 [Postechiella marina]|uniref:histidine kinase n=1 Tax=Postechiella marina TaxID=943941 RepID=A0ABP8CA63_9FLAO